MKNKKLTPYLLVVVLIVWGAIMYRVYKTVNANNNPDKFQIKTSEVALQSIDTIINDYSLMLSYKDPFLKDVERTPKKKQVNITSKSARPVIRKPLVKEKIIEKDPIRWDEIKYSGSFLNKKTGDNIALISFFNTPLTVKEGEEKNGLLVRKIYGDSLIIRYSGKDKTILK